MLTFDAQITQFLSNLLPHNALFDGIFAFLSLEGNYFLLWLLIFMYLFFAEKKKEWRFILIFFITLGITLFTVDHVLKPIFQRDRPYIAQSLNSPICPQDYSFPSGHAAGAFAGATVLAWHDKKRKKYYYFTAALIAFSRIYLQCHYLFDISFGALFGYVVSTVILHNTAYNKIKPKTKRS